MKRTFQISFIILFVAILLVAFLYQNRDFIIEANKNSNGFSIVAYRGVELKVKVPAIYQGKKITAIEGYQSNEKGVFQNSNVSHILVEEGIQNIGFWTFGSCKNLVQINLPSTLKSIAPYCFVDCINLETITIPVSVNIIGNYAFYGCTNLSVIILESIHPPFLENAVSVFLETSPFLVIKVPANSIDTYQNAQGWVLYSRKMIPY